jgi:hypothetical protein
VAGRTCAGNFTKRWNKRRAWLDGLCGKSSGFTGLKNNCVNTAPGPRLRPAVRASQSRPIVERIQRALVRLKHTRQYLPQSLLGQAMDYARGQWPTLTVCLENGRIEIDNHPVENAIRPTAIGKKNWRFVGDADAGQRSAIIDTVIENCRRRGLDPFAYLREVLTRLSNMTNWQIPEVIPQAWKKKRLPVQRLAP